MPKLVYQPPTRLFVHRRRWRHHQPNLYYKTNRHSEMQIVLNCFDSHVIRVFFKQVTLSIVTIVFHVQFDFAPVYSASEGHEGHKQTEKAYLSSWMNIGQSQH